MAPTSEQTEDGKEEKKGKTKSSFSNPTVLRAALDIVKHKKQEAVEKEQYDQAARFHQKIQQLEAQLAIVEAGEAGAAGASTSSAAGEEEEEEDEPPKKVVQRRSLLSAPNPFRTVELLEQSGYSRRQACGMLLLLYIMVFVLELLLVYVGWKVLGLGGDSAEDGAEDLMEEL
mmetsp:Transcript_5869/g.10601  ORF Transcript_5869/g.10601 Transcript_5869/m.10601 type:complete len:173 (-) Transcript_5869:173-691(-)